MLLKNRVRRLALCAVLTAMSVVLLYLSALLPTGQLAVSAMAALLPAAAVICCGLGWGAGVYVATSLLALLLVPQKGSVLAYCLVLGHYPVFKSLIERLDRLALEWVLKLCLFYALLAVFYFGFSQLFLELISVPAQFTLVLFLLCGVAFVLYDIAFSRLIGLFERRIAKYLK